MSQDRIFNFVQCWHCGAEIRTPNEDKLEAEVAEYRNALLNCITQIQFYLDVCEFQDSGNAAIKAIEALLQKYEP